jgi:lipoprotein signal peptidase
MIKNFGMSFGKMLPGLIWFESGIWAVTVVWLLKSKNWRVGLMVVGGGLNLWERFKWGFVVDYWRIPFTNIYNNVNDWLIFIGAGLYIWQQWKKK